MFGLVGAVRRAWSGAIRQRLTRTEPLAFAVLAREWLASGLARIVIISLAPARRLDAEAPGAPSLFAEAAGARGLIISPAPASARVDIISLVPAGARVDIISLVPAGACVGIISLVPASTRVDIISLVPASTRVDIISLVPASARFDLAEAARCLFAEALAPAAEASRIARAIALEAPAAVRAIALKPRPLKARPLEAGAVPTMTAAFALRRPGFLAFWASVGPFAAPWAI